MISTYSVIEKSYILAYPFDLKKKWIGKDMQKSIILLFLLFTLLQATDIITVGKQAPSFSLRNLESKYEKLRTWCGDSLISPFTNKERHAVILSFWSTTCLPCAKEIPLLEKFMEKHKDEKVKLFCISVDPEGAPKVKNHIKKMGWNVPVLIDKYGVTAKKYGLVKVNKKSGRKEVAVPTLVVIDTMRTVLYAQTGFEEEGFESKLEEILWPSKNESGEANE